MTGGEDLYARWRLRCASEGEFALWLLSARQEARRERRQLTRNDFCDQAEGSWCVAMRRGGRCALSEDEELLRATLGRIDASN